MRNSLNPWKYWKNQVFRTGHTGCSGRRNNLANWYTGCWHGLSTAEADRFRGCCRGSSFLAFQWGDLCQDRVCTRRPG